MKYSWQLDNFDSEVFGFKVAKIIRIDSEGSSQTLNRRVKDLIRELIKNKIRYATYRVQSNNFPVIHALEKIGFILVDGLISLNIDANNIEIEKLAHEIREANKNDLNSLKDLTSGLYSINRVFNDPLIPKNKANEFYIKWVENSLLGKAADSILVWEEKKKILGYITLQKKGQIPLLGVSPEARGKGIAKRLVMSSLNKFKEWGVEVVTIETQMGNIPALRVYQDCGFKIINSFLTLRWAIDD